ncbi:MAG: hypothetical protein B7C24_10055 [Bacteroidetes bacterium 4572_77]|nr:MAG: hypothetical protein B7C24_10055 [Bacteroidetes bacterium 4572_77]
MSIIRKTSSGEHYLQKISTEADKATGSAIQFYDKQVGSDGVTSNTIFSIAQPYVVDSNTLLVFVNGQKIEKVVAASLTTEYEETNATTITVGSSLLDTDVVEFLIVGSYILDEVDVDSFKDLAPVFASDHGYDGFTSTMTVGENVVFGDVLYLKSDGKYWKADADADTTMPVTAVAVATILADASGKVMHYGYARDDSWAWTVGGILYTSTTAGGITETAPSGSGDQVQVIGIATHADRIFFNPELTIFEIA